jgi:hypothetical protein
MLYRTVRPLVVEAVRVEKPTDVDTPQGKVHVERGEWLVRESGSTLFSCDASYFARTFEQVDSRNLPGEIDGKPCGC